VKLRPNGSIIASIAIHVVVVAAVLQALVAPQHLAWIFMPRLDVEPPTERIRYIAIAPAAGGSPAGRTIAPTREQPRPVAALPTRLVAPAVVPAGIPEAPRAPTPPPATSGVTGTDPDPRGQGGVALVPGGTDPRLWSVPAPYIPRELSHAEMLAESLDRHIRAGADSAAAVAARSRRPGDWTVDRDGNKWGMDEKAIYFGKYSVPTALLALLPIRGAQGNPNIAERAERIGEMSAEIRERSSLELDARDEIKRIAARKDRERAARLRARQGQSGSSTTSGASGGGSTPPPPPG
jgi:hypothetical protein